MDYAYDETGTASWYGEAFNGRPTANGETFDLTQVSAAHKTLQLPSVVEVTNLQNGRALKVRVNDRGPFAGDRIIDLSRRAAQLLGFERAGTAPVRVKIIKEESIKVAEAAMRGDIGQTRLAQEPRIGSDLGSRRGAEPGRGSGGAAGLRCDLLAVAAVAAGSPGPVPALSPLPAEPPQVASERLAEPAEHVAARRSTWPTLIASAHAAPMPAYCRAGSDRPLPRHPAGSSSRPGCLRSRRTRNRVRARFASHTGTEVVARQRQRQRAVPGEAGAGGERGGGAAFAWRACAERNPRRPGRRQLTRQGSAGEDWRGSDAANASEA